MSEPFVGEIRMGGWNFAPRGWASCSGQLLSISQNDALFSLLGTIYGGDGETTFGLPDLRGRFPVHKSSAMRIGQKSGSENEVIGVNHMPNHRHQVAAASVGSVTQPAGNVISGDGSGIALQFGNAPTDLSPILNNTGGNQSHNNLPPFQVVTFVIALFGIYPSQS